MTPLTLYAARARVHVTLKTGHRVAGPWLAVARVHRRHLVLSDGTSWPLPAPGHACVYPDGHYTLEIDHGSNS